MDVPTYNLRAPSMELARQRFHEMLAEEHLEAPQQVGEEVTWVPCVARVALREPSFKAVIGAESGDWWELAGRGYLGVPLQEGTPLEVVHFPKDAPLEQTEGMALPDATAEQLAPRVDRWLERRFAEYRDPRSVGLAWEGGYLVVQIPVVTFTFHHPLEDDEGRAWTGRTEGDQYSVSFAIHDASKLGSNLPRRTVVRSYRRVKIGCAVVAVIVVLGSCCGGIGWLLDTYVRGG